MKINELRKILVVLTALVTISSLPAFGLVREPAVAGQFYPADSAELRAMVVGQLGYVIDLPPVDGQLIGLIVPHAGLIYSGQVAAYGYELLENSGIENVILCGPSHRFAFQGLSVYGPYINWKTPLGMVKSNTDLCDKLVNLDRNIEVIRQAQEQEHSLEVQLPYLQTVLKQFEIVPIVMGAQNRATIELLAKALKSIPDDNKTIMIASSDWQHYRPASEGWVLDSTGLECFKEMDPVKLEKYLEVGRTEMCGGGPAVAVLKAAISKGANKAVILKYGDSGDSSGDKSKVVGYAAIALIKSQDPSDDSSNNTKKSKDIGEELPRQLELTEADKKELLIIARKSIASYLAGEQVPDFHVSDNLNKFGAAFVTLNKNKTLRGCIGYTSAVEELYKTVSECAISAAVRDPRFPPVKSDEMKQVSIEISVLSPMQPVKSFDDIQVGRDGLMIFKGQYRGLLLPQVATEYGWNRTEFLEQTCRKAGLDKDAYLADDAVIYKFQATVFGE